MDANTVLDQLSGMIPSFFKRPQVQQEIIPIGNAALNGAKNYLLSKTVRNAISDFL